ncbi:MAG: hypothetical protein CSA62_12275 [Planctomycetota bacterium]|nr:MAG: hypothetical protein CSA62_12275 [Planctomycetota bacterium]
MLKARYSLFFLTAIAFSLPASSLAAQTGKDLGKPKLKPRVIKRLQGQLQAWFEPQMEGDGLANRGAEQSSRGRKKIRQLNKKAREGRQSFIKALRKNDEKVGGVLGSIPDLLQIFDGCFPKKKVFSSGKIAREWTNKREKLGPYWILRPKGYQPNKNWPLVITLASRDTDKVQDYLTQLWPEGSERSKDRLIVAPELPKDHDLSTVTNILSQREVSAERPKLSWMLKVLGRLFNVYRLDTDRIYLDAIGDSTPFAMRLVSLFPDRFGGLILRDPQGIESLTVANTHLVPILVIGKKGEETMDKLKKQLEAGKHPQFKIIEADGEAPYADQGQAVFEWMKGAARNLFASTVQLQPPHDLFRKGYWIRITQGDFLNQTSEEERPMVKAVADREKNRIEITARNVDQIQLFFNDALIDLSKEFTLVINGKIQKDKRTRRLLNMANSAYLRGDSRFLFTTSAQYNVPKGETSEDK